MEEYIYIYILPIKILKIHNDNYSEIPFQTLKKIKNKIKSYHELYKINK